MTPCLESPFMYVAEKCACRVVFSVPVLMKSYWEPALELCVCFSLLTLGWKKALGVSAGPIPLSRNSG